MSDQIIITLNNYLDENGNILSRTDLNSRIALIQKQNEKLKKCVEFYANTSNWRDLNDRTEPNNETNIIGDSEETGIDAFFDACFVGGKLARQTLKEIGK